MKKKLTTFTDEEFRAIQAMRVEFDGEAILSAEDVIRRGIWTLWQIKHPGMAYPDSDGKIDTVPSERIIST